MLKFAQIPKNSNKMAGISKFRSLYLLNQFSFSNNFFTFQFLSTCSIKIMYNFSHEVKINLILLLVV